MNLLTAFVIISASLFSAVSPAPLHTKDCQPHYVDGFELPAWVTNDTWYRPMPQYTTGRVVWYAPGIMNSTARYRGMDLTGFAGGIATTSVGNMGHVAWLKRPGLPWEGPFLIVDVSQRNHAYYHAVIVGTIAEVDFDTALEWGIVGLDKSKRGYHINMWSMDDVEMWIGLSPPNSAGGADVGEPVNYRAWYEANAEFCDGQPNRRWSPDETMIMNYEDFTIRRNSEDAGDTALQETSIELTQQQISNALTVRAYLTSLSINAPPPTEAPSSAPTNILTIHTLSPDETWTHLALKYYGHTTEPYWRLIYEANKDMVGDDYHRIWGGMKIVIPVLPANFSP